MKPRHYLATRNLITDRNDPHQVKRRSDLLALISGATRACTLDFPGRPVLADRHGKRDLESGGVFEANGVRLLADELAPHSNLMKAGCTLVDFGIGNIDHELPAIDPTLRAGWQTTAELAAVLSRCLMSQRRLSARVTFSNQLARQSPDVSIAYIEAQLYSAIAAELERAALLGSGAFGEPCGLLLEPSVETLDRAVGSAAFAEAEQLIADSFHEGELSVLTSPAARRTLRGTVYELSAWGPELPKFVSPHLKDAGNTPGDVAVVGSFAELIVGTWGGISLLANPYSRDIEGFTSYLFELQCDIISLRPASFKIINPA
jgi:hypothetical protein